MIYAKRTLIDDDGGTHKDYRGTFPRGCPANLPEESPEQHAGYSFSLIHKIVSLGSRLTPDKSARNSSELHALWNQKGSSSIGTGVLFERNPGRQHWPTPAGVVGPTSGERSEVNVETSFTETTPSAREQIKGNLSALMGMAHAGVVSYVPTNPGWEREGMVREPLAKKHRGWVELRQQFTTRFSTKRACFKDPKEITKIVRKANKTLVAFKERWIIETSFITGVPEVMKISSFMDANQCPELAKRYSDIVPKTVDEMMTRLDDFVKSEEAFASTELPKGEASEASRNRQTGQQKGKIGSTGEAAIKR
ncbi:hypothetical protein Tco_1493083 [Tanacetum coccineum]